MNSIDLDKDLNIVVRMDGLPIMKYEVSVFDENANLLDSVADRNNTFISNQTIQKDNFSNSDSSFLGFEFSFHVRFQSNNTELFCFELELNQVDDSGNKRIIHTISADQDNKCFFIDAHAATCVQQEEIDVLS